MNYRAKQIIGWGLIIVASLSYKLRDTISLALLTPTSILVIALFLAIVGLIILFIDNKKANRKDVNFKQEFIGYLKRNGERIVMTSDNCRVLENNYYNEITKNGTDTATVADALFDPNRNVSRVFVKQSAIIYYYQSNGRKLRLTSQTFPCTKEELMDYMRDGKVKLYVDRFDKEKYAFELK